MFCFLQRLAQFIFPLHLNEPIAPSSVHVTLLGVNALSLSLSPGHTPHSAGHGVLTNGVFVNTILSCLLLLLSLASLGTTCHMLT